MVWQLIECPRSSKIAITSFKTFFIGITQNLRLLWRNCRMKQINMACIHPLQVSRISPSQLIPSNLVTNIFFYILQTYWFQNYSSKGRVCRNRHVKAPEGPWMADRGAARPGWRSETPNMQPLTEMTSDMRWRIQSCLMYFWIRPVDLWHINISDCLTLLSTVLGFVRENQFYVF